VSIGRRLVDLVRSNFGSLFDREEHAGKSSSSSSSSTRLEDLSDEELELELQRRRQRREAAERAADRSVEAEAWSEVEAAMREQSGRFRSSSGRRGRRTTGPTAAASRRPAGQDPRLAQLYAQLECPYGADMNAVRKQYRALMRKYHPDMHSNSPEKQRLATELSQRLTMAYNDLRRTLGG
jgi:DnaJ-domain-containing protein 1